MSLNMLLFFRQKGRQKLWIFAAVVTSVLLFYNFYVLSSSSEIPKPSPGPENYPVRIYNSNKGSGGGADVTGGDTGRKLDEVSYVVNTSTCKIPDLDPWGEDFRLISRKCIYEQDEVDPMCRERPLRRWMYKMASNLIVNHSAVKESGFSPSSIRCCYHLIERVEQSLDKYDENADLIIRYSKTCYPLHVYNVNQIEEEFIRVFCLSTWPFFNDAVYREFFAFAQPDSHAREKIAKWKSLPADTDTPPNIVILGVDTNSRLNSHRRLSKTLKVLDSMGAIEFFGYTKNAENTFPNTIAFLEGFTPSQHSAICQKTSKDYLDECPFIWKDFDRAGYLTATTEDAPVASSFNFLTTGFVSKPTDFYPRPYTLAWKKESRESRWLAKCVGRYLPPEMILTYLKDILDRGSGGAPVFIHSWFTAVSHRCINTVQFEDPAFHNFVSNMDKNQTILFFMSDHGDRYGAFRETTTGWYEDKLPSMWVYIPERIRNKFPDWYPALQINSRRLTSHFDLYYTLVQILNSYKNVDSNFQVNTPQQKIGQSLFEPVPENRTCDDVAIPSSYCPCKQPEPIDVNSKDETVQSIFKNVTNAAISYLTKTLPKECAPPVLKRVVSGKVVDMHLSQTKVYIVSFYTDPGDFLYEVTATAMLAGGDDDQKEVTGESRKQEKLTYSVDGLSDILRMNKITRKVNCVTSPVWERYCYCL